MAYRFVECFDHSAQFAASIREHGLAPVPTERFRQEAALFGFFVSGLSSIECFLYGLHALAWAASGNRFAMETGNQKRGVTIQATTGGFVECFPNDQITAELSALREEDGFVEWSELRNVLAHRAAPGRLINLQLGGAETVHALREWGELPDAFASWLYCGALGWLSKE
jgi:hypothetical protein